MYANKSCVYAGNLCGYANMSGVYAGSLCVYAKRVCVHAIFSRVRPKPPQRVKFDEKCPFSSFFSLRRTLGKGDTSPKTPQSRRVPAPGPPSQGQSDPAKLAIPLPITEIRPGRTGSTPSVTHSDGKMGTGGTAPSHAVGGSCLPLRQRQRRDLPQPKATPWEPRPQ